MEYIAGMLTGIFLTYIHFMFVGRTSNLGDDWIIWCDWRSHIEGFKEAEKQCATEVRYSSCGYKNNNRKKTEITIHFVNAENQVRRLLK